jgi:luciferase family oxidoreductase group 1
VVVPVSFLDLTPIEANSTSRVALANSVELATLADRLGYFRYWFAEHHNTIGLASSAPEIMIEHIASRTSHLRVGSGGVMLPNHSPLKIVETFRLLEALHPGRIDLGMGRAPGTDTLTAFAMRRSREALQADDYPEQLAEMMAFDGDGFPDDHAFRKITAAPFDVKLPPIWLLGSSGFSAQLAAREGLAFSFAAHINRAAAVPALRAYRAQFVPSGRYAEPRAMLTVSVTIGKTYEHAEQLSKINDLVILRLRTGKLGSYPTLQQALDYQFSPAEEAMIASMPINYLMGDADQVYEQILDLYERSEADEIMITTMLPDLEDRKRTLMEMARKFGLTEGAGVTPFPDRVGALI